ncbi:MAG: excinuclease ABC subunit UvrC [Acidobacteria bacterium]|nr:MAG: excinuclease ABC subunit UvrC [Acidobacteriota bacterium]MCE7957211.1 excinuclease ABC subunit UvrC [Acidobacteria bacterium ACB2]
MGAPPDLSLYPDQPGIYVFRDARGRAIYVGKARSIRKRLASYFQSGPKHPKTEAMLSEFATVDTVVATNESEALALENAFIKRHRPRYNVLLRDDKTYPYIKVTTGETWPRAYVTRRYQKDSHSYFGPFLPARTCRGAMKMVQRLFQVRTCSIEIDGTLPRPCLYYDMNACLGPCVAGLTTKAAYDEAVEDVLLFLAGRNEELAPRLRARMEAAAEAERFELAAVHRDCLRTVEELAQKQRVQLLSGEDADVFGEFADGGNLSVALLLVRGGTVLDSREWHWEGIGEVEPEELWGSLLSQYYDATSFLPREVHLPVELSGEVLEPLEAWLGERRGGRVTVRTPRRGAAFERVRMARDNARQNHLRRFRRVREAGERATLALARALDLDRRPARIEGFDVSHFQGADTFASCVVFVDGEPAKGEYRAFRIEREAPDDFASIAEAVSRRYARLRDEGRELPDLLVVDGGKGQLSSALSALDRIGVELPAVGLAKREEHLFVPGRSAPVVLPRRHPGLRLLQRVRDEAHRFGLKHHRRARGRAATRSPLLEIPGIGPRTVARLLAAFGGAEAVLAATPESLAVAAGKAVAARVERHRRRLSGGTG